MTRVRVNRFWSEVNGHPSALSLQDINTDSLDQAACIAVSTLDCTFAFRRNSELIDLHGHFRHFSHRGRAFVLKIANPRDAVREYGNAEEMARRISRGKQFSDIEMQVVMPSIIRLPGGKCAVVSPDRGYTLHENPENTRSCFPKDSLVELIRSLLNRGIEWPGCVPRNLIYDSKQKTLYLIDAEEVTFFDVRQAHHINPLSRFFWILNWAQIYGSIELVKESLDPALSLAVPEDMTPCLDSFETTYQGMVNGEISPSNVRYQCCEATLLSESPVGSQDDTKLQPADIGHLVDDLMPRQISVLYTFATARLRRQAGSYAYRCFIEAFANAMRIVVGESGGEHSIRLCLEPVKQVAVLMCLAAVKGGKHDLSRRIRLASTLDEVLVAVRHRNSVCSALCQLQRLSGVSGWQTATKRADLLDTTLSGVFSAMMEIFGIEDQPVILVRGSLGQGIVTAVSDVDFEISSDRHPKGLIELERVIGAILDIFGIHWEGSEGRPKERDLVSRTGLTRDLHEWMELRLPGSADHDTGWLKTHFDNPMNECCQRRSLHEQSPGSLTAKSLFWELRCLIARLSFGKGCRYARTDWQLEFLARLLSPEESNRLFRIAKIVLAAYEERITSYADIVSLGKRIAELRGYFRLPGPIR